MTEKFSEIHPRYDESGARDLTLESKVDPLHGMQIGTNEGLSSSLLSFEAKL